MDNIQGDNDEKKNQLKLVNKEEEEGKNKHKIDEPKKYENKINEDIKEVKERQSKKEGPKIEIEEGEEEEELEQKKQEEKKEEKDIKELKNILDIIQNEKGKDVPIDQKENNAIKGEIQPENKEGKKKNLSAQDIALFSC